jgi:hypothetical protein
MSGKEGKCRDDSSICWKSFSEQYLPPILNSVSQKVICLNLLKLTRDKDVRNRIGQQSKEWIIKTHSLEVVASKHLELFSKIIT